MKRVKTVSKTVEPARVPWVRIRPSPPSCRWCRISTRCAGCSSPSRSAASRSRSTPSSTIGSGGGGDRRLARQYHGQPLGEHHPARRHGPRHRTGSPIGPRVSRNRESGENLNVGPSSTTAMSGREVWPDKVLAVLLLPAESAQRTSRLTSRPARAFDRLLGPHGKICVASKVGSDVQLICSVCVEDICRWTLP